MLAYTGVHFNGERGIIYYFLTELPGLPAAMLVAYVNMYILIPRFFHLKKYLAYIGGSLLLLFIASVLSRTLAEKLVEPVFFPSETYEEDVFVWYMLFKGMLWFLSPVLLLTLVIQVFKKSYEQERTAQETAREKLNAELNFLKGQIHPHFLFNTLNNLYSLTLQQSPVAPQIVLKLSELISYMLYDSQSPEVTLAQEIKHICNYVELEKLRYGRRLDVSINVSGEVNTQRIAPLLLIPFVENAFKHGVSNETDTVWVTISIRIKTGWLNVLVENSCSANEVSHESKNFNQGIGLQNVMRRLHLLYPGSHQLELTRDEERFLADLKLRTNNDQ